MPALRLAFFRRLARWKAIRAIPALLAALVWLLTMQAPSAANPPGTADHRHAAATQSNAGHPAANHADEGHRPGVPAGMCGACPSLCCVAALPTLSPPEPRHDAAPMKRLIAPADLLAGLSLSPDPPPPRLS